MNPIITDGSLSARVVNIVIDGKPLGNYETFIDVYDGNGSSIKSLLNGTGYVIPFKAEGKFTVVFAKDAFASGQVLNVSLMTGEYESPTTTCRIP